MKRKYLILLHCCVWLVLLSNKLWSTLSINVFGPDKSAPFGLHLFFEYLVINITYLCIPLICFYSAYLLVAPLLIHKKKYFKAVVCAALTFAVICAWRYYSEYYFFLPVFGFDNYRGHPWPFTDYISNVFFYYFPSYFVYGLMYFFVESWYKTRLRQQELQKEKAAAELAFLRSQVNPHFLFNSINDIYSLTYQKSEQAPAALLKLSEVLRYMLREDSDSVVPLSGEVKYIENVIDLQRISAKGAAFINFKLDGQVDGQKVPSLIFIPFAENAFKHGVLNDAENPVEITLTVMPKSICFAVKNKKSADQKDHTGGIGLSNVRRRLDLLYPGTHVLTINDQGDFYTVNLKLQQ